MKPSVRAVVFCITLMGLGGFAPLLHADTPKLSNELSEVEQDLKQAQKASQQIEHETNQLLAALQETAQKKSKHLATQRQTQKAIAELNANVQASQRRLKKLSDQVRQQETNLSTLLVALYKQQHHSTLRRFFSGDSLDEGKRLQFYSHKMTSSLTDKIAHWQTLALKLTEEQRQLDEKSKQLATASQRLNQQQQALQKIEKNQQRLIAQLKQQQAATDTRINRLKKEQAKLESLIQAAKERARLAGNVTKHKGKLPWPVKGKLGYDNSGLAKKNQSLVIIAPLQTSVNSIGSGEVVYADWIAGYGNLVMIAHGQEVISIYAWLYDIRVQVGQKVNASTQIGTVGKSGGRQTKASLFFQIRHKGKVVNPKHWLHRK